MSSSQAMPFHAWGVWVDARQDNVAVCKTPLAAGAVLAMPDGGCLTLQVDVRRGERLAMTAIPAGETVRQYGCGFALSRGLAPGEPVRREKLLDIPVDLDAPITPMPEPSPRPVVASRHFLGHVRPGGGVGTRNYLLLIPTSLCASEVARQAAVAAEARFHLAADFPQVDGVIAIPHTEGCGCASNQQIDRLLRVLSLYAGHVNVGWSLVIDLGCEQTNQAALQRHLGQPGMGRGLPRMDWLTIQQEGGVGRTIDRALDIMAQRLPLVNASQRQPASLAGLVVGTECGGSDAFSGITANPVIGGVVDRVVAAGGSALLTETPEMVGTEHLLMARMRDTRTMDKFRRMMRWYQDLARLLGVDMANNLVPENIAGGLLNPCIKSLGAITKGGTGPIEDVLDYGEPLVTPGLNIMQGPGNDLESVTGLTASGANIICFSTGKGTVTGAAITPVIKIAATSQLFQRMPDDMDFDAGVILDNRQPIGHNELAEMLLDQVIAVASGQRTCAERHRQHQFQVWTAGKLSL